MFSIRSSSVLFLGLAASIFVAGCDGGNPDEVFSPDESRSDVGAIARSDTSFPVAVGTMVPDANGVATRLTPTMQGLRLQLSEIRVKGTCDSDSSGEGEFYYQIGINGRDIARRPSDRWYSAHEGATIPLDVSRVFFVEPTETFTFHVSVSEEDDFMNGGDDDVGSRHVAYTAASLGGGMWRDLDIGSDSCGVVLTYSIDRLQ